MRDVLSEVVRELETQTQTIRRDRKVPLLEHGWERGCPKSREERALIEVWVAFSTKMVDRYNGDVGRLESQVTELANKLAKANGSIAQQAEELRSLDGGKKMVAFNAHLDRLGDSVTEEEATRTLAEAS